VHKEALASAGRLEKVKTPQQAELDRNKTLEMAYRTAAYASYRLKNYADADVEMKRALELRRSIPARNLNEKRDEADMRVLAALIAARMGKDADAQQLLEPALKLHRDLYSRGADNEDQSQRLEFAAALYASALASPSQRTSQLAQAASILDALPAGMRNLISTTRLREAVAEEQKRH
jgi:tetratricopeptide (TPR) repeat protein